MKHADTPIDSLADLNGGTGVELNSGVARRNSAMSNALAGFFESISTLIGNHALSNTQFGITAGCTRFIFSNAPIGNGEFISRFFDSDHALCDRGKFTPARPDLRLLFASYGMIRFGF
jgi:hypothetical protein